MELITAKTNSNRSIPGVTEVSKNKGTLNKWLSEVGLRLGDANPVVKNKQQKAEENFASVGLPDRKTEDFKYTHIRTYLKEDYLAKNDNIKVGVEDFQPLLSDEFVSVVMVNGKYIPEYSRLKMLPEEVTIKSLFKALEEGNEIAIKQFNSGLEKTTNPLTMLNTALAGDGIFISIPENFSCPVPVHIANICTGEPKSFYNPRNLVYLHKNSQFTLIESYHSIKQTEETFTNSATEFYRK
jgi:Fe-S cluster assembly protein SufD